jgi:hypothetical protein
MGMIYTIFGTSAREIDMAKAKTKLTRKDVNDLYGARTILMNNREAADAGNQNAKTLVASARETISRLTAKRDNRIWL